MVSRPAPASALATRRLAALVTLTLLGFGLVAWQASAQSVRRGWVDFEAPSYEVSFQVPADWHVTTDGLIARHDGFDPVMISSFEIPAGYNYEWGPPPGEVMFHVAFDANDYDPSRSFFDYVWNEIASREYMPTGREPRIGGKTFVELRGEMGTLLLTHRGPNVYSVFVYGEPKNLRDRQLREIVRGIEMHATESIYIPEASRGLGGGGVPAALPHAPRIYKAAPSMKLPWASGVAYGYTGGPHGGAVAWSCSALRNTSEQDGIDFGLPDNTEVLAAAAGTVRYAGNTGDARGYMVTIEHVGYGFATQYWHLKSTSVTNGTAVVQGKVIGRSGNTGDPGTAYHLHLELRNYPSLTSYSAHGVTIDGYKVYTYTRASDNMGYNYQGTMVKGTVTNPTFTHCSANGKKWEGSTTTVTALSSGANKVTSSNTRVQ